MVGTDLISRANAIEMINKTIKSNKSIHYEMKYWEDGMNCARQIVEELPSTERTGYWIDTGSGQECSVCREIQYGYDTGRHFCSNCGARMVSENDSR